MIHYILLQKLGLARHEIEEQEKVIANLEEVNRKLRAKIKKPEQTPAATTKVGRNSSWRQSAKLGLREGIWLAPTRLVQMTWRPLIAAVGGAGIVVVSLFAWLIARIGLVVAGLTGFLIETKETK